MSNSIDSESLADIIDSTITMHIENAQQHHLSADTIYELLNTRRDLLVACGITKNVCRKQATDDDMDCAMKYECDSSTFTYDVAEYRGRRYPIYEDEYGECEEIVIGGTGFPIGDYNDFELNKSDIGYLAEQNYTLEMMYNLFGSKWASLLTK